MPKLFVAGCSFSDYTLVKNVYGEFLAEKLGYTYVHEGEGCGSNYRIWRKITNHIIDGNLNHDDILIVQYTELTRQEFYSKFSNHNYDRGVHVPEAEKYHDGGAIIKFKVHAHTWQHNSAESAFFKVYENNFLSDEFEQEKFKIFNFNFQQTLKNFGIRTIFIKTHRLGPIINLHEHIVGSFRSWVFDDVETSSSANYNLAPNDKAHMNLEGHKDLAERLYTHIQNLKWI